MKSQRYYK